MVHVKTIERHRSIECPACGARLRGTRFVGYTCNRCHAHFSARFVTQIQRQQFRELVSKHFDAREHHVTQNIEKSEVIIPDPKGEIARAIEQAQASAHGVVARLQEAVDANDIPTANRARTTALREQVAQALEQVRAAKQSLKAAHARARKRKKSTPAVKRKKAKPRRVTKQKRRKSRR